MCFMSLEQSFLNIFYFLEEHRYLHELEIMERYPFPLVAPYHDWTLELMHLTEQQLIDLECYSETSFLKSLSLIDFINKTSEVSKVTRLNVTPSKIAKELNRKLTPKKTHEIQTIKSMIETKDSIDTIIDVGSGAGHLSSAIVCDNDIHSFCIDMNKDFQELGVKKLKHWCPKVLNQLTFIQSQINEEQRFSFSFNPENTILVGLHACGPLSTHLIKSFKLNECKELINFGCCYHKMVDEYNISNVAKDGLKFSNHALTMAAKGHTIFNLKDFEKRLLVKKFRYTLHFYSQEILKQPFQTLGNAKAKDYQGKFSQYVMKYYSSDSLNENELQSYFESEQNQFNLRYAICAGVLRSKLARPIEVYINLDRALYLYENGYDVNLYEIFDRKYGPRNLGLIAKKL